MQVEQSVKVVEIVALGMDPPVVLDAETPLREVLQRMRDENSGCALVTRENRLAGRNDLAELWFHARCYFRKHLADRLSKVFRDGQTVDAG